MPDQIRALEIPLDPLAERRALFVVLREITAQLAGG